MEEGKYQVNDFIMNESFQRYVQHNSRKDALYWESWIEKHPDALTAINEAKEVLTFITNRKSYRKNTVSSEQVFEKLKKQIKSEKNRNLKSVSNIKIKYLSIAASIILLIGIGLIMARYYVWSDSADLTKQYLEVVVPDGQRSQLLLPDGTKVWLNSGTVFKYPTDFLEQGRNVYLDGEAFFNVQHINSAPFIVRLKENLSVKVLGTEFNVKSYANEGLIETALVKGKVKLIKEDSKNRILQEISLNPNEKAVFQKSTKKIKISNLNTEFRNRAVNSIIKDSSSGEDLDVITAWTEEKLVFRDETFAEISIKMERWFGMKVTIADEDLKEERFTGKFVNKENIYQVLDIFNRSEPIHYYTEHNELIITKR